MASYKVTVQLEMETDADSREEAETIIEEELWEFADEIINLYAEEYD